jgi:hypothetical protein
MTIPVRWGLGSLLGPSAPAALVAAVLAFASPVHAALITAGTPTTHVPAGLADPLAKLADPLPAGRFLLPIEVTGAVGLEDWQFDLAFDATVVAPLDVGGLYQSAYQAAFSASDPTLSDITSSGLALPGRLEGIAGFFSSRVSGDGTLTYVLFQYQPGQEGQDPRAVVDPPPEPLPEPSSMGLLGAALLALGATRRRRPWAPTAPRAARSITSRTQR